jgi:hypothetical protein
MAGLWLKKGLSSSKKPLSPETQAVAFSVYLERLGANLNGWSDKNADGTLFVGRMPMVQDTGMCCIIAKPEPLGNWVNTYRGLTRSRISR